MTVQFDRDVRIKVEGLDIAGLHASFRIVKTLRKEPNTCELTIFNLSQPHRDEIAQSKAPIVEIKAGYKGRDDPGAALIEVPALPFGAGDDEPEEPGLVFLGNVRDADSGFEPPDWITSLESGDGEKATRFSRINKSFVAGTSLATVLNEVAKSMSVGIGNAKKQIAKGNLLEAGKAFLNSVTVSGQSSKELDRIVKSAGLEWSIQDGALQLLELRKPLADVSIVLAPDTGLIGSPTIGNDGIVRVRSLLNSDIVPGRELEIDSKVLTQGPSEGGLADVLGVNLDLDAALGLGGAESGSRFRAERVEYIGSNYDRDYYCDIEAVEL